MRLSLTVAALAFGLACGIGSEPASAAPVGPAQIAAPDSGITQARMTKRQMMMRRHRMMRGHKMRGRMMRSRGGMGDMRSSTRGNAEMNSRPLSQQNLGQTSGGPSR